MRRLALLVSGASGMRLPLHFLRRVAPWPEVGRIHLVTSAGATQVLRHELALTAPGAEALVERARLTDGVRTKISIHRDGELDAPISSGSYRLDGTVILPCSAATLGALATGAGSHLIQRAGAVALKEQWPLVLGFRETPLTVLHLENLRRLAHAGAVVLPPIPAFYIGGEELDRFLDAYVQRVCDHLGLGGPEGGELRWPQAGAKSALGEA